MWQFFVNELSTFTFKPETKIAMPVIDHWPLKDYVSLNGMMITSNGFINSWKLSRLV
jgi:hypothetical protein